MLIINYVIIDGEYKIYEKKFNENFFEIYRIYKQDYVPKKKDCNKGVNYKKLWDIKLDKGLEITDTSYNTTWRIDDVYIRLCKYTRRSLDDITRNMETVRLGGSTYFYDESCIFYDGPSGSGKSCDKRVISKRGNHNYMVTASGDSKELLKDISLEMLVDLIYDYNKDIEGFEKCKETWIVSYSDGTINGFININVAPYGINEHKDLKNNDEFVFKKVNGTEYYITKERVSDDQPNHRMLSFNSGIGVVVITAGVPYSERNDVPDNALDFVNIDLAKEIVDYIIR
jgi:hypothetical protein